MRRYGKLLAPGWLGGHASALFLQSFKHNTHLGVRLYFDFSAKRKETLGLSLETKPSMQISVASKNQQDILLHLELKSLEKEHIQGGQEPLHPFTFLLFHVM